MSEDLKPTKAEDDDFVTTLDMFLETARQFAAAPMYDDGAGGLLTLTEFVAKKMRGEDVRPFRNIVKEYNIRYGDEGGPDSIVYDLMPSTNVSKTDVEKALNSIKPGLIGRPGQNTRIKSHPRLVAVSAAIQDELYVQTTPEGKKKNPDLIQFFSGKILPDGEVDFAHLDLEIPGYQQPFVPAGYSFFPMFGIVMYDRGAIAQAYYNERVSGIFYEEAAQASSYLNVYGDLKECVETHFYGTSGLDGMMGRLEKTATVHQGSKHIAAMNMSKIHLLGHTSGHDAQAMNLRINASPQRFYEKSVRGEIELLRKVFAIKKDYLPLNVDKLPLLEVVYGNLPVSKVMYSQYNARGVPYEDSRVPSLLRFNTKASAGLYYQGKHREVMHNEVAAASIMLAFFSKSPDFYKKVAWANAAKVVNKQEVYPLSKKGNAERIIYATNTFFYLPLQVALKVFLSRCSKITETGGNPVRLLYPFSPAQGSFSNLTESMVLDEWTSFVYSDNIYFGKKTLAGLEWISLDGSKMEGSHNSVSAILLAIEFIDIGFGYTLHPDSYQDFRTLILNADKSGAGGNVKRSLFELKFQSPPQQTGRTLTDGWLRYLIFAFYSSVNVIGVLGKEQFTVPGMASGVAPTFFMNSVKMILIAARILAARKNKGIAALDAISQSVSENGQPIEEYFKSNRVIKDGNNSPMGNFQTDFKVPEFIDSTARYHGVVLKGELCSVSALTSGAEPQGIYPTDLLGHDVRVVETVPGTVSKILVLDRERLVKMICFSKPDFSGMKEAKALTTTLYHLLNLVRYRTAFMVGGWAYPGLMRLLYSLIDVNQVGLGQVSMDINTAQILSRTLKAFIDPSSTQTWIDEVLDPASMSADVLQFRAPTLQNIFRIYGRAEDYSTAANYEARKSSFLSDFLGEFHQVGTDEDEKSYDPDIVRLDYEYHAVPHSATSAMLQMTELDDVIGPSFDFFLEEDNPDVITVQSYIPDDMRVSSYLSSSADEYRKSVSELRKERKIAKDALLANDDEFNYYTQVYMTLMSSLPDQYLVFPYLDTFQIPDIDDPYYEDSDLDRKQAFKYLSKTTTEGGSSLLAEYDKLWGFILEDISQDPYVNKHIDKRKLAAIKRLATKPSPDNVAGKRVRRDHYLNLASCYVAFVRSGPDTNIRSIRLNMSMHPSLFVKSGEFQGRPLFIFHT